MTSTLAIIDDDFRVAGGDPMPKRDVGDFEHLAEQDVATDHLIQTSVAVEALGQSPQ